MTTRNSYYHAVRLESHAKSLGVPAQMEAHKRLTSVPKTCERLVLEMETDPLVLGC